MQRDKWQNMDSFEAIQTNKEKEMSIEQVVNAVSIAIHNLLIWKVSINNSKNRQKMQHTMQRLENDVAAKEYKISRLDKIAFSSEQECRRTELQLQELIAQKYRMQKVIANILNNDQQGYSKLKQIARET